MLNIIETKIIIMQLKDKEHMASIIAYLKVIKIIREITSPLFLFNKRRDYSLKK